MKSLRMRVAVGVLLACVLGAGCSKSSEPSGVSLPGASAGTKGLRIGMVYEDGYPSCQSPQTGQYVFGGNRYVFRDSGVSVYDTVAQRGDVYRNINTGEVLTSAYQIVSGDFRVPLPGGNPRGSRFADVWEVIYGPGDGMPLLDNARYSVQGASVYVDWSQHHSQYFGLSSCGSGSEVWNVKNDGLILESATSVGTTLTVNLNSTPVSAQGAMNSQADQLREQNMRLIDSLHSR